MLVAVFPLLAGLLFRWLLRRWRRGWLLTAGAAALALILFLWASTIPIPGSEGPMLWTIQAACLTLALATTALGVFSLALLGGSICHRIEREGVAR